MKNPWAADSWSIAAQGEVVRQYGVDVAKRQARMVGSFLGATAPATLEQKNKLTVLVQRRNFTTIEGGFGSSGNGPPED